MSTPNFLQIKPNGINLPSNTATVVASPGDLAYNSTSNQYAVFNTAADFLLTANGAAGVITGLTNVNLSGSAGITNANLASMASQTVKGNITGSSATPSDVALGSIIETTSSVLTITGTNTTVGNTTIQVSEATTSTSGYLSSADWNTFNNKATAGNYITALNGDISASGPGVATSSIVATTNATLTTLSALTTASSLASVGTITAGTWNATTIAIAHGGTGQITANAAFNALSPMTTNGDMIYMTGGVAARLPTPVTNNEVLTSISGAPTWTNISALPIPQGTKNYLAQYAASSGGGTLNPGNGNFESGTTTGWSLGTIGALTHGLPSGTPTFGSGASGNLSFTTVTAGNQLGGTYSGALVSSAATTQSDMVASDAFFIDQEDQAKALTYRLYYKTPSGASAANYSGTSSNSFAVAVWDITNSSFIPVTGAFGMTQNSGTGYMTGTFQTPINTVSMRFVVYNANSTSGAITLLIDDIFVGPQTAPIGGAMQDLGSVPWTPTGTFTTNTSYTGSWARVGKYLSGKVKLTFSGAPNSVAVATLNLPFSIDTLSMPVLGSANFGTAELNHSAGSLYSLELIYISTNSLGLIYQSAVTGLQSPVNQTAPVTIASTDTIEISFTDVPIVGWSSNVQMSNDTDTRVVAMQVSQATPTATLSSTPSLLKFTSTPTQDTHGGFNSSTGLYTCPVSGYYRCSVGAIIAATFSSAGFCLVTIAKNGVQTPITVGPNLVSGATGTNPFVSGTIYCNSGDTLAPYAATSGTSPSIGSNANQNVFSIERLSGPSVIAATESVNATYGLTTAQVVSANSVVKFDTKIKDSHNAFSTSTGLYTVPVSGQYRISIIVNVNTANTNTVYLEINGTAIAYLTEITQNQTASASVSWPMLAGQTIAIFADSGGTFTSFAAANNRYINLLSIERVGN